MKYLWLATLLLLLATPLNAAQQSTGWSFDSSDAPGSLAIRHDVAHHRITYNGDELTMQFQFRVGHDTHIRFNMPTNVTGQTNLLPLIHDDMHIYINDAYLTTMPQGYYGLDPNEHIIQIANRQIYNVTLKTTINPDYETITKHAGDIGHGTPEECAAANQRPNCVGPFPDGVADYFGWLQIQEVDDPQLQGNTTQLGIKYELNAGFVYTLPNTTPDCTITKLTQAPPQEIPQIKMIPLWQYTCQQPTEFNFHFNQLKGMEHILTLYLNDEPLRNPAGNPLTTKTTGMVQAVLPAGTHNIYAQFIITDDKPLRIEHTLAHPGWYEEHQTISINEGGDYPWWLIIIPVLFIIMILIVKKRRKDANKAKPKKPAKHFKTMK